VVRWYLVGEFAAHGLRTTDYDGECKALTADLHWFDFEKLAAAEPLSGKLSRRSKTRRKIRFQIRKSAVDLNQELL